MVKYIHTNNASSNLRDDISAVTTTIRVTSGHGIRFPNPGADEAFFVTVEDRRLGKIEIMLCTSRITDTLTVVRGQQGTTPQTFTAGVNVSNRVTAQLLNEFAVATVDVIPVSRLPIIPDSKIQTVNANKIVSLGSPASKLNPLVLPNIPSTVLTNVPAGNVLPGPGTAKVPLGSLPVMDTAHLPAIDPSKLTNVPAGNVALGPGTISPSNPGTLPPEVLPDIPQAKLTNVPAPNLNGLVPNTALQGSYTLITSLHGSGNCIFDGGEHYGSRFIGRGVDASIDGGSQAVPTFSWAGHLDTGLYYSPGVSGIGFTVDGVVRSTLSPSAFTVQSGAKFTGDGGGLTNVPATALPQPGDTAGQIAERGRISGHIADASVFSVGSYMFMHYAGSDIGPGTTVAGDTLRPSNATGTILGSDRPNTEQWICHGYIPAGGSDQSRTTLFKRVG